MGNPNCIYVNLGTLTYDNNALVYLSKQVDQNMRQRTYLDLMEDMADNTPNEFHAQPPYQLDEQIYAAHELHATLADYRSGRQNLLIKVGTETSQLESLIADNPDSIVSDVIDGDEIMKMSLRLMVRPVGG